MKNNPLLFSLRSSLKYGITALLVIYLALLFIFTGESVKPFSKVEKAVEESIEGETGVEKVGVKAFKRRYGLEAQNYEGVLYFRAKNPLSAEEILLIEVKNKGQIPDVRRAFEKALQERKDYFSDFSPRQARMIGSSTLAVRGRYLFLTVCEKAQEYQKVFLKSL